MKNDSEVFISYAWDNQNTGGISREEMVNELYVTLSSKGFKVIKDKVSPSSGGKISDFMKELGSGKYVVLIVTDKYLKSEYCMAEILELLKTNDFKDRIFPVILSDANIFDELNRLEYLDYWSEKRESLEYRIRDLKELKDARVAQTKLKQFDDIREIIGEFTGFIKEVNSLSPDMHGDKDFDELVNFIESKQKEDFFETTAATNKPVIPTSPMVPTTPVTPATPVAPATPVPPTSPVVKTQVDLPITFQESNVDYALIDFGDNVSAIVVDPTDPNNKVAKSTKLATAEIWAGTFAGRNGLAKPVPFSASKTKMAVRVWSPDADTPILLKVENASNSAISSEVLVNTTKAKAWEILEFDFANGDPAVDPANTYDKVSIFFNFGTDGATSGEKTYYWDNIEFVPVTTTVVTPPPVLPPHPEPPAIPHHPEPPRPPVKKTSVVKIAGIAGGLLLLAFLAFNFMKDSPRIADPHPIPPPAESGIINGVNINVRKEPYTTRGNNKIGELTRGDKVKILKSREIKAAGNAYELKKGSTFFYGQNRSKQTQLKKGLAVTYMGPSNHPDMMEVKVAFNETRDEIGEMYAMDLEKIGNVTWLKVDAESLPESGWLLGKYVD